MAELKPCPFCGATEKTGLIHEGIVVGDFFLLFLAVAVVVKLAITTQKTEQSRHGTREQIKDYRREVDDG